jgi:hypothetical protein
MTVLDIPFPSTADPTQLADWAESMLVLYKRPHASRSWLRSHLRRGLFPDDGIGPDDLLASDLDVALESLLSEVSARQHEASVGYPFAVSAGGLGIDYRPDKRHAVYVFLLLVANCPTSRRERRRYMEIDETFDLLVAEAVKAYFGSCCVAIRFGSPASDDRPTNFARAVPWLAGKLGLRAGQGPFRSHTGDGGADVVAWLPIGDDKPSFVVVLVQCTIRQSWHNKGRDLVPDRWRGYIDLGVDPVTCLAVPFAVRSTSDRWDELRRTSGVVLDRFRLARLIRAAPRHLMQDLLRWTKSEAKRAGAKGNVLRFAQG